MKLRFEKKRVVRRVGALFLAVVLCCLPVGCSSSNTLENGSIVNEETIGGLASDTLALNTKGNTENNVDNAGMGRYMEKTVLELKNSSIPLQVHKMEDGRLAMFHSQDGIYVSEDNGDTWELESLDWLSAYNNENYTQVGDMSREGLIVLAYSLSSDIGLEKDDENNSWRFYRHMFVLPDGTQREFDMELSSEEYQVSRFAFDDATGRLFVATHGDTIYELNLDDGSKQEVVNISGSKQYIICKNNLLMCVTSDEIYLYDLTERSFIEDEILQDFIRENYSYFDGTVAGSLNVLVFFGESSGEDKVLYIVGEKGLHRHVIGGSTIEQVIDGSLSSLGDPVHMFASAAMLDNQEFLVEFTDGKLMKYTYDATIPTIPNDRLKVYSLTENDTIRQAISVFQTTNPEMYVIYEVGMEGNGVTREDALKKLNTTLLDGTGPDVLILDDMPIASYIDKDILMDISADISKVDEAEGLYMNLFAPFRQEEYLYVVPVEFKLPAIAGHQDLLQSADSLEGIADLFEALRAKYPNKDLLGINSEKGVLKSFIEVCEPSWKKGTVLSESKSIDTDLLKEFLQQCKRIYTAQISGLSKEEINKYYSTYEKREDSSYFYMMNADKYFRETVQLICGNIDSSYEYNTLNSLSKKEGFEDSVWKPLDGQSSNVFIPVTLAGVNALSENSEQALAFLRLILGEEVQKNVFYGFPVNKKAFENCFVVPKDWIGEDGGYMYFGGISEDGVDMSYGIYVPDDAQLQQIRDWVAKSDTPYIRNVVLEDIVYTEGARYLRGEIELDAAVGKIMDNVEVYLLE